MNRCIFLRHGEVDNSRKVFYGRSIDLPLNTAGERQIQNVAQLISRLPEKVTSIYTSPLLRTRQTAQIVSQKIQVPVVILDGLIDVDIPALVGKPLIIRRELHAKGTDEYSSEWVKKGNETSQEIIERMLKAFRMVQKENEHGFPLVVSHGDPLAFLLFRLENSQKPLPSIGSILQEGYNIEKGEGMYLVFDNSGKITKKERMRSYLVNSK